MGLLALTTEPLMIKGAEEAERGTAGRRKRRLQTETDRNTINVGSCHQSESAAQKKPQHQQKTGTVALIEEEGGVG